LEILIAVLMLAIAIGPMMSAFAPGIFATRGEERTAVFTNRCRATLNRAASLGFQKLYANRGSPVNLTSLFGSSLEAAKETFVFKGTSFTPVLSIIDMSGGKGGLVEVEVRVDYVTLKTLQAEY
jgi:hypothetical protein